MQCAPFRIALVLGLGGAIVACAAGRRSPAPVRPAATARVGPVASGPLVRPRPDLGRVRVPTMTSDMGLVPVPGGKTAILRRYGEAGDRILDLETHALSQPLRFRFVPLGCEPRLLGLGGSTQAVVADDHGRPLERFELGGRPTADVALLLDVFDLSVASTRPVVALVADRVDGADRQGVEVWDFTEPHARRRTRILAPFEYGVGARIRSDGAVVIVTGCHDMAPLSNCAFALYDATTGKPLPTKPPPVGATYATWDDDSRAVWTDGAARRLWDPASGLSAEEKNAAAISAVRRRAGKIEATCARPAPLVFGEAGVERVGPRDTRELVVPMFRQLSLMSLHVSPEGAHFAARLSFLRVQQVLFDPWKEPFSVVDVALAGNARGWQWPGAPAGRGTVRVVPAAANGELVEAGTTLRRCTVDPVALVAPRYPAPDPSRTFSVAAAKLSLDGEGLLVGVHVDWPRGGEGHLLRYRARDCALEWGPLSIGGIGNASDWDVSPDGEVRFERGIVTRAGAIDSPGIGRTRSLVEDGLVAAVYERDKGGPIVRAGGAWRELVDPGFGSRGSATLAVSADGTLVAGTNDDALVVWNVSSGAIASRARLDAKADALAIARPDHRIFAATDDGLSVIAIETGARLYLRAFTRGGATRFLVEASDGRIDGDDELLDAVTYETKDGALGLRDVEARFGVALRTKGLARAWFGP